jgi:hypothetical protein
MSLNSLSCPPPIRRKVKAYRPDFTRYEEAIELHNQGQFRPSVERVFDHLFSAEHPGRSPEGIVFEQGSSRVVARYSGDELIIRVPMARLTPDCKATAALRFLLTRLSSSGQLYQPRLRGEEISLEFHEKLSRLHPAKLVEVLRRMPTAADANDDWMVEHFGVEPLERVAIEPLDEDEFSRAEAFWRTHWEEVDALLKEAQRKRLLPFLNELTAYAYYHLIYAIPLGGYLLARISESADSFNNTQLDPEMRESILGKFVKEARAVRREELARSLGHARFALSPLGEGNRSAFENYLGPNDYTEAIHKARVTGRVLDAALALVGNYSFLLARFSWPDEIEAALLEGLRLADGKPLREAASQLWTQARTILDLFKEDDEDDEGNEDEDGEDEGEGEGEGEGEASPGASGSDEREEESASDRRQP